MEANILPFSSFNDMVFEGRNKAYSAYALRQAYHQELIKAAGISFTSVLLLFGLIFFAGQLNQEFYNKTIKPPAAIKVNQFIVEPIIPEPVIPEVINPAPATIEPTTPAISQAKVAYREVKIVTDITPVTDNIPSQTDLLLAEPGLYNVAGDLPGTGIAATDGKTGPTSTTTIGTEDKPFIVVEQMPEFPDGLAAMYKFINKNLRYPSQAQARGLEGAVILSFVVSATGEISDIEIIKDIGGGAGEEAKRVIRKMPVWRPGKQNKQAVPVRFTLPIKFKLN